jgi:ribonuclease III
VLGLVVAERLMDANPDADEGELTHGRAAAVNRTALAASARALGFEGWVRLGRGARRQGVRTRDSTLANALEAVIGALYLDGGLEVARAFVLRELDVPLRTRRTRDAKSALQELLQSQGREPPRYATVSSEGPPHARAFAVEVRAGETLLGTGSGPSKRAAEQSAATSALTSMTAQKPAPTREETP